MADSTRPTWSAGALTASAVATNTLTLTWSGATDDTVVTTYRVYRGTSAIGDVTAPTVTLDVTGLRAGSTYDFSVQALDAAGNQSIDGPTARVTMQVADYFQLQIKGVYSKNTDYSNPKIVFEPSRYSVMPTEFIRMTVEAEISVGSDIDTSIWDSISLLMVKNLDTAINLDVTVLNANHTEAPGCVARIAPGGVYVTTDVTPAGKVNVMSTDGGDVVMCEVIVVGN